MDKIYKQLTKVLEDAGVKEIEACGAEFDPNFHNAVMHVEDDSLGENVVAEVLQKKLEELEPDVHVVLEKKSDLTESLKMVGSDPKAAPDMYFFAHDKIGVYAEMDILAPITDIIPEEELDVYMDNTLEAAAYKGEIYQLPVYYETLLFMYNRLYMKDDEVPQTTEELYQYMQDNTAGGHYGFVEQHSTPYYAAGWINGFNGTILSEDGTPGLDSKETIAALEYHKKFVDLMPGETEYATVNTLFKDLSLLKKRFLLLSEPACIFSFEPIYGIMNNNCIESGQKKARIGVSASY